MSEFEYAAYHAFFAFILGCALALFGDDVTAWLIALINMSMALMHVRLGFEAERNPGAA